MFKNINSFIQKKIVFIDQYRGLHNDSYTLSKNIKTLLNNGNIKDAITKVRNHSRNVSCTIAWNHIINYCMNAGRISFGLKCFNEMKKRAHFPNAQTFTILLHGLFKNIQNPKSVSYALYIYKSLWSSKYNDRLCIIHVNAILHVCAVAKKHQTAFEIFEEISSNNFVADTVTYTILFNILSHENMKDINMYNRRQRILGQVVKLWKEGSLIVDESLACSIARSFLCGKNLEDKDFVFSLVEFFFGIKRLEPPLKRNSSIFVDNTNLSLFSPISKNIKIGNKGLNIILLACLSLKKGNIALEYWNFIINNFNFVPDHNNCYNYFLLFLHTKSKTDINKRIEELMLKYNNLNTHTISLYMKMCNKNKTLNDYIIAETILKISLKFKIKINIHIIDFLMETSIRIGSKNVVLDSFNILRLFDSESLIFVINQVKDKYEKQNAILIRDRIRYNIIKYSKYLSEDEYKYLQMLEKKIIKI
ncbi:hypothetical protein PORY_000920 [Pneumocystis oryctolagi]|uniref:Uncharacterized protein n=1 Tax=Pneumocystis oryctolagi TaxID=42067 RepID=A0ACB7CFZ4_9ASCO|nr:hypothetical protein PORY_000920 [Pneumocystis oryctolagi]